MMEHRAFVFDYQAFDEQLKPILERALTTGDTGELVDYIESNRAGLQDPYEGASLDGEWEEMVETKDAHQYGDFALTGFYDPRDELGLGEDWEHIQELLLQELGTDAPVLGNTVGPSGRYFDPGKMGSYFQSAQQVKHNLEKVRELSAEKPELSSDLDELEEMLEAAVGKGLYVTF